MWMFSQGMFPVWISRTSGRFTNNQILTVGAMGDSFYEYLLKVWLLLRKQVRPWLIVPSHQSDLPEALQYQGLELRSWPLRNTLSEMSFTIALDPSAAAFGAVLVCAGQLLVEASNLLAKRPIQTAS